MNRLDNYSRYPPKGPRLMTIGAILLVVLFVFILIILL